MRKLLILLFFYFISLNSCLAQTRSPLPIWEVLYDSAQIYWDSNWPKTLALLQRAEKEALLDLGIYDQNYLTITNDLGLAYSHVNDYENAEKFLSTTLKIKRDRYDDNYAEVTTAIINLANLYAEHGNHNSAKKLYKSILQKAPDKGLEQYIVSLRNLLLLYERMNQLDSVDYFLSSITVVNRLKSSGDKSFPYEIALIKGRVYRKQKNYVASAAILQSNIQQLFKSDMEGSVSLYISSLQELGQLEMSQGLYSAAERHFIQAYRAANAQLGSNSNNLLLTALLNDLATVYDKLNVYDKALAYYNQSLSLCESSFDKSSLQCAILQNNIAGIYLQQGNFAHAISTYEAIQKIFKTVLPSSDPLYITTLNNLATAYQKNNQNDKARACLDEGLGLIKKYNLEKDDLAATLMNNLAVLLTATGKLDQASQYYENALAIKQTIYGTESVQLLDLTSNMAIVYWALNKKDRALPMLDRSMKLSLHQIRYIFPSLSANEQIQFYKKLKEDFERYNTVATQWSSSNPELLTQMFNNQILIKSLMFFTQKRRSEFIHQQGDSVLSAEFELLKSKQEQLGYLYQLPLKDLNQSNLSTKMLEAEIDRLEKTIALKTNDPEATRSVRVDWHTIQLSLQPDEALVELIRFRKYDLRRTNDISISLAKFGFTDSVYYAALITTTETELYPDLVILKEGSNMETRFMSYYKNALTYDLPDENSYDAYWSRIQLALATKSKIYLSPDGVYHKLNLNILKNATTGTYVLQQYNLHQLLNPAQVFDHKKLPPNTNHKAVLIGDPMFDADLSVAAKKREEDMGHKFGGLPGTYAEIISTDEILKTHGWSTSVYLKNTATEMNLKKVHSPGILHIATHGFFSTEVVSLNEEAKNNFLFHSGLILSGANKHTDQQTEAFHDDGIVTAYEVMNLDLTDTDLVVLSACETGLGTVENGEGVYGLQRSFLQAGARNVLISLWKVDDQLTKELMVSFYGFLLKGYSKRESLKHAQLQQMKHVKNPMLWGGFILIGVD